MAIQSVSFSAAGMAYFTSAAEMLENGLVDRSADKSVDRLLDEKLFDMSVDSYTDRAANRALGR